MAKYRKKPIIIEAIQWLGGDMSPLNEFCDRNWGRADAVGDERWPCDITDREQVMVRNAAEQVWLPVPVGWWIIRGVKGELYPCAPDIFAASYEPV